MQLNSFARNAAGMTLKSRSYLPSGVTIVSYRSLQQRICYTQVPINYFGGIMDATKRSYDIPKFKEQYENYIGGEWVAPTSGEYFDCISPVDGRSFTKIARSNEADVEAAVEAAHAAFETWGKTSATERSNILLKMADRME